MFFVVSISHAQVSLGIRGGYVNSGLASSGNSTAPGTSHQDNWQAGAYLNAPLFTRGYLQAGMGYIVKGAGLNYEHLHPDLFGSAVTKLKLQYLELPVNMVYKLPVSFGKLIVGAGPYAAYCVRGDYNVTAYDGIKQVQSGSQHLNFNSSPNIFGTTMNLQRWDAGLNFTAGVEFNCFLTLSAHYGYGLLDIDKSANELKNRYWGVSFGFLFDREDW
ncbi:outer membrane beta-barrel protein [Chitinophaga sp.]|uniref:outer membrane beta-barrel protein n=1 Tax=Chitinophaga sp. TaxID=1869181 RepID=UPI002F943D5F